MSKSGRIGALGVVLVMLNGCGGGGSSIGCNDCAHTAGSIDADVKGLLGSRLALSNNGSTVTIAPGASGHVAGVFSGLASGASYNITVATQPTNPSQTCTVTNGTGTVGTSTAAISVSCTTTPARFLITQDGLGSSKGCLTLTNIDKDSGVLSAVGAQPFCGVPANAQTGGGVIPPFGPMTVDPQGKFLYVVIPNGQIGFSENFTINHDSGALTYTGGGSSVEPGAPAMHPAGTFMFQLATGLNTDLGGVGVYKIDPASGALTPVGGSTFTGAAGRMFVDPVGRFLYVTVSASDTATTGHEDVTPLVFDSNSGVLSKGGAAVAVRNADWFVPDPSGKYVFVGTHSFPASTYAISTYKVDPNNGALTAVAGASVTGTGESSPSAAVDPTGRYLYMAEFTSHTVVAYAIDRNTGTLAPINGSPFSTGVDPWNLVIDPQGKFLYVSNDSGLSGYQIDNANGSLSALQGSPFPFAVGGGSMLFSY
jgi:6-phosphogluconolactonase